MTRRERLEATLRGDEVDRPAVSFYEIGGRKIDRFDQDPFNIYNSPDWWSILDLAERETDLMRMMSPVAIPTRSNCREDYFSSDRWEEGVYRYNKTTIKVAGKTLTSLQRRDRDSGISWTLEHPLKEVGDVRAYLQLPDEVFEYDYQVDTLLQEENALGDTGIAMVDLADPLCVAARLFSMEDFLVFAATEGPLFHELLSQAARWIYPMVESVSKAIPGRLWRACGSEYASEPYLPASLYAEYWLQYTEPIIRVVQGDGGYVRVHSHGRLKNILPLIRVSAAAGIDPIEPPPLGDVELNDVRKDYGQQMVLFGNIEVVDIERLPPQQFAQKLRKTLREGTKGSGRGFVLQPSACPNGRSLSPYTLPNYKSMVNAVKKLA